MWTDPSGTTWRRATSVARGDNPARLRARRHFLAASAAAVDVDARRELSTRTSAGRHSRKNPSACERERINRPHRDRTMALNSSTTAFAKSTRPEIGSVVSRERLFSRLDGTAARTVAWISAPPGFGKTTLAASYLEARNYRWAWYEVDRDDDDGETFFHYRRSRGAQAVRGGDSTCRRSGPEHRDDLAAFSRRFFRTLFAGVRRPDRARARQPARAGGDSPICAGSSRPDCRRCRGSAASSSRAATRAARSAWLACRPSGQMVCTVRPTS